MTIPTDEEMKKFQDELETFGPHEVHRKLNQGIYAQGSWKSKEVNRFLEKTNNELMDKNAKDLVAQAEESNKISKESNQIARWALGVSIVALIISLLVFLFK